MIEGAIVDTNLELLKAMHTRIRETPSDDVLIAAVTALLELAIYEREMKFACGGLR